MYWLLYDISSQKKRNKLVQICKDFGLKRVQKSCFYGNLHQKKISLFSEKLEECMGDNDSICMVPVTKAEIKETRTWGVILPECGEEERKNICFF